MNGTIGPDRSLGLLGCFKPGIQLSGITLDGKEGYRDN
jgi:hypothetical protein